MKKIIFSLICLMTMSCIPTQAMTYYVAVTGNDNNPGTFDQPWATWQKGFSTAKAGDVVYIRGGTYYADTKDAFGVSVSGKSGTLSNPISVFNYPGEVPILDCSTITSSTDNNGIYLSNCKYIHLQGLTVTGVRQPNGGSESNGVSIEGGNFIIMENCTSHGNAGPGFFSYAVPNITYINCDAYDNFDHLTSDYSGGQADGFVACYAISTSVTIFDGCRSWYNSDDGYDCWYNEGKVIFRNDWAFENGRGDGDGNGFKLGSAKSSTTVKRTLTNCIAANNNGNGFDKNGARVGTVLYNNVAYNNSGVGFEFSGDKNIVNVKNCFTFSDNKAFNSKSVQANNVWKGLSLGDVVSVDASQLVNARNGNELPIITFMHPAGSKLIDKGVNVGLPYTGSAPDIGYIEKQ